MLTGFRGILQVVLMALSGAAGYDLWSQVGLDPMNPAFWGDVFSLLSTMGLTFGLGKDRFVQVVTFGLGIAKKFDESDLPNGCNATMNWLVAGLKRGVPEAELKPTFDAQWEIIVRECRPQSAEVKP